MKRWRTSQTGLSILLVYLALVVAVQLLRVFTGWPLERWLGSSPILLAHGQIWRLVTSAFVIEGPPVPQVIVTALLGGLIIWFRGSWLFWGVVAAGHIIGTLLAYLLILILNSVDVRQLHHFLRAPDYGISLIWSSALGVVAAMSWAKPRQHGEPPYRLWITLGSVLVIIIVVVLSGGNDAVQHAIAFLVGAALITIVDRSGRVRMRARVRRTTS